MRPEARWPAMRRTILLLVGLGLVLAGCGAGTRHTAPATTTAPPAKAATTTTAGAGALQAEANAAATGDIPDNQVFLVFRDSPAGYSVKYPEGWAQGGAGPAVTFRDKNNAVRIVVRTAPRPTPANVRRDLGAGATVTAAPTRVSLPAGPALEVVYRTTSAPSPVTGKRVTLTVDRYALWRGGREALLDLGTPVGVDNVDAYRLIAQSFRWR
jgi:hypothetical protein